MTIEPITGRAVEPSASATDPVRRLVAAFLVGYEGHTRKAYARDLSDWLTFCARRGIEPLAARRAHVDAYARKLAEIQRRSRATVARRLSALAGFYGYALDEGLIDRSPLAGVRRPKVADDSQTTGLDRDQLRAVLAAARSRAATCAGQSSRNLALVTLLAHNGLRIGEALAANVEDLGTERGHRTLRIIRKGSRRATVVLAPVTARALDDYLGDRDSGPLFITAGGRRLDEPAAFRMVRQLARAAGLDCADRLSPHSLRHAFVTLALDAGVSLRDVQDAAGHADPRTTRRYDRARHNLDRAATYAVAAYLAGDTDHGQNSP
jgi:site-specific recombinase XerD